MLKKHSHIQDTPAAARLVVSSPTLPIRKARSPDSRAKQRQFDLHLHLNLTIRDTALSESVNTGKPKGYHDLYASGRFSLDSYL